MNAKTKTTVNAKNPGISLMLCRIPISAPVKLTLSIAKLLSRFIHTAINKQQFCSFNDWRLPTRNELETLLNYYGESDILIDLRFFPNTQNTTYWTSVSLENNPSLAYEVPFFFGGSIVRDKSIDTHIRLVRSAD